MSYHCEIKEQPSQAALSIRIRTSVQDLPIVLGNGFSTVARYLGEIGEQPMGPPFVAYYNRDMEDLDMEIGFPISRKLPGKADIKASEIPGGKMGTCMYTGPYPDMSPAYEALNKLVKDEGYEPTGIVYEIYFNSPMDTAPEKLQTLILFPLKNA